MSVALAAQVGRVPSTVIPLDARDEARFAALMADLLLVDLHQHTMVMPADLGHAYEYAASYAYTWGYDAIRAGRWSTVGAACNMAALMRGVDGSFIAFDDLRDEIALMLADVVHQPEGADGAVRGATSNAPIRRAKSVCSRSPSTWRSATSCTGSTCCTAWACAWPA